MKRVWMSMLVAGVIMMSTAWVSAQPIIVRNIGTLGLGTDIAANFDFTGREIYVVTFRLGVNVRPNGNAGMVIATEGTADTEIALYGPNGVGLIACNDDGDSGSWGDPGLSSRLIFGNTEGSGTNGDGWNGFTNQTPTEFVNPNALDAGNYMLVVATFSSIWDEVNARRTTQEGRERGNSTVRIRIFNDN